MKTHQKAMLCLCFIATIFQSCKDAASTNQQAEQQTVTEQTQEVDTKYLVTSDGFYGMKKNQKIPKDLEKSVLKTGDGDFDIFLIKDENGNKIGHVHPNPNDESTVGHFIVTSPKAFTSTGLKIGMTFDELQKKYPNAEVHGSEIEGYTFAKIEEIFYFLDFNNWDYDFDTKLIPANTKIIEISN